MQSATRAKSSTLIGLMMLQTVCWDWTGRDAAVMKRALYNALLPSIAIDAKDPIGIGSESWIDRSNGGGSSHCSLLIQPSESMRKRATFH